ARLYGAFSTANSPWDQPPPQGFADWTVAPAREPPELYRVHSADRRWGNSLLSLYQAPRDLLFQSGWERRGDYPTSARGEPLTLRALPTWIALAPGPGFGEG